MNTLLGMLYARHTWEEKKFLAWNNFNRRNEANGIRERKIRMVNVTKWMPNDGDDEHDDDADENKSS